MRRRIALTGPLSVADYMAACVADPDGYYARQKPFGVEGDFVTAPEISQMFGELIGAFLTDRWQADGAPSPVDLCELGPGRGTLMADALSVMGRAEDLLSASRLVLVEVSDKLAALQRQRLAPLHPRLSFAARPPEGRPLYLVANEFFDALPIRQFVSREGRWFERTVGLVDGALAFGLSPFPSPLKAEAPDGAVKEVCPAAEALVAEIARTLVAAQKGAALIVDYGHTGGAGSETLQAVRDHRPVGVLEAPGAVDLSAHVDFSALAAAARREGAFVHGPVGQGTFLLALGLLERAGALGASASAHERQAIEAAVHRLAGEGAGEMGTLFKVICITPGATPPPGF
ncbi:MAG: SAM-dependent methyltransferase [Pseudomonadota bacterium]